MLFNGQREIRRTLKTDSRRLAQKRARQFVARFESAFDKVVSVIERDEHGLSEADYIELLELLPAMERLPDFSSPKDDSQPAEPILSNEELEARLRRREVARLLTGVYDRPIPHEHEALAKQLLELSQPYLATELRAVLPKLRDELVLRKLAPIADHSGVEQERQPLPKHDPAMAGWTLYQVWEHQLARDRADTSSKGGQASHGGTLEERERRARVMTALTHHKPVCQLSKQDWQAAYDAARRIKSGTKVSLSPTPTPLNEVLTDDTQQMAGHERVSALIASMKQIQNHARHIDLTSVRVDDLIIKPVQKRANERSRDGSPFSLDDIEAIFSGFIYQGSIPTDRTKAYPFWFWMPLVGYFTGARTNEIAQLDSTDIKKIDGHPCFDFCADDPKTPEAKRIKTGESRQVPIHPRLIELGFLDYVNSQLQANQKKLFGDGLTYLQQRNNSTDHNKEGWAKSAGKFFNETPKGYLVSIGVHVPHDGKSLYSFRHTLETNLRDARRSGANIDQTVIDAITGHTPEDIAGRHYDGGPSISHKLDALKNLPIPPALQNLKSYKINFTTRFGERLSNSIIRHRKKYPRTL